MTPRIARLSERSELREQIARLHDAAWPPFMRQALVRDANWPTLFSRFADYQVLLLDEEGELMAAGHALPVQWDGTVGGLPAGWSELLAGGVQGEMTGQIPTTLAALAVVVDSRHARKGLSRQVLLALKEVATSDGLEALLVPVRPTRKSLYPLIPIERYVTWRREDGAPFDPWLRTHWRIGGEILAVAPRSRLVSGTVGEWEQWTGLAFPDSGEYVVSGALQPVRIDRERDEGHYYDPNVWVRHLVTDPG